MLYELTAISKKPENAIKEEPAAMQTTDELTPDIYSIRKEYGCDMEASGSF